MKIRTLLASIMLALALVAGLAVPSQAAAGDYGQIYNKSTSTGQIAVYNVTGQPGIWIRPGHNTSQYAGWNWRVRYFRVESNCQANSQYSPAGSYPYIGGKTYWTNGLFLNMQVVCFA
jgi:hypothetical protein